MSYFTLSDTVDIKVIIIYMAMNMSKYLEGTRDNVSDDIRLWPSYLSWEGRSGTQYTRSSINRIDMLQKQVKIVNKWKLLILDTNASSWVSRYVSDQTTRKTTVRYGNSWSLNSLTPIYTTKSSHLNRMVTRCQLGRPWCYYMNVKTSIHIFKMKHLQYWIYQAIEWNNQGSASKAS